MQKTITITEKEYEAYLKLRYSFENRNVWKENKTFIGQGMVEFNENRMQDAIDELNQISKERENQLKAI